MRVIGGRYEGDTGLIVRVEDNLIVLFSDLTMHELKTMPKDLQLCTDMATGTGHQTPDIFLHLTLQAWTRSASTSSGTWCR